MGKSVAGPRLMYWPRVSSMKKMGMPASNSIVAYGIRKAAEKVCTVAANCSHIFL